MKYCEFIEKCPIYALYKREGNENKWLREYCLGGEPGACARIRHRLLSNGKIVPLTLLPDGSHRGSDLKIERLEN